MTTKRINLVAGTILGGALLLGTAGFVLAQDPTTGPSPSATHEMSGGMMGDQDMMGGQDMMSGGMMGGGQMPDMTGGGQMPDMTAMHAAMAKDGTCDPELMK
jgi:hypothetical protein